MKASVGEKIAKSGYFGKNATKLCTFAIFCDRIISPGKDARFSARKRKK